MTIKLKYQILTNSIALVWLVNGLYCKVLNFVPRHEEIVSQILGEQYSRELTFLIGIGEVMISVWIWSQYKIKENTYLQLALVGLMNLLEFTLVPDLLLWGRFNLLFAILFMFSVYYRYRISLKIES